MKRFEDQVAIVTGSASGIGRATAIRLAAEGAAVVIADVNLEGAGNVAKSISEGGGRALAVQVDVTDAPGVRAMTERAVAAFGKVDILVSNAGWDGPLRSPTPTRSSGTASSRSTTAVTWPPVTPLFLI